MTKVTMPEPVAYIRSSSMLSPSPRCVASLAYVSQIDQERGELYEPVITTTQAEAYADARVREALEIMAAEAHQACINYCNGHATNFEDELKQAIRALIPTPPTEKP